MAPHTMRSPFPRAALVEAHAIRKASFPAEKVSMYGWRKCLAAPRASTCVEELAVGVRTEPLTKKDLVNHLASGCKPEYLWRIGTEHEKFGYEMGNLKPLRYQRITQLLEGIASQHHWEKIVEDGLLIGLRKDGKTITLEGGGQVELSGAPLITLHQTAAEIDSYLFEMNNVAENMGIGFLGCGTHPNCPSHAFPIIPKEKNLLQLEFFSKSGTTGRDMLLNTCSVQVSLDFSSEEDMVTKMRVALALQPIVTAIFSNSPFTNGKPNGFLSYRSEIYKDIDACRTGMLPFVFDDNFGFERYVDYALSVPMMYAYRRKRFISCHGMSFKDFIFGRLPNLPGDIATMGDWQNHLMQIYTEVRLKTYLEMRGADATARKDLCALPALWVGLLYDKTSLRAAARMIEDWTAQECQNLRHEVTTLGLKTPFRGSAIKHVAQDVVKLAKEGLERRGWEEMMFLDSVVDVVETGKTPAERLLNSFDTNWNGNVDKMFGELLY